MGDRVFLYWWCCLSLACIAHYLAIQWSDDRWLRQLKADESLRAECEATTPGSHINAGRGNNESQARTAPPE